VSDKIMELGQVMKVQVAVDCHVTVVFTGTVTQEAIDKLIENLNLAKDTYPTRDSFEKEALAEMANESQKLGLYEDFDTGEEEAE
jgi:hypothetical protein